MGHEDKIYCRKCARHRLMRRGVSPSDAFVIAERVYKEIKEVVDKHAKL